MEKLITIQKRENLNTVRSIGDKGNGGAYHEYEILSEIPSIPDGMYETIKTPIIFQNLARKELDSIPGVLDTDLLEIVRHRLQCFQAGGYATRYNAVALTHIEEALMWMNRRVEDRIERNVLGTMEK